MGVKLPSPGFHLNFSYDGVEALCWALRCISCEMLFKSFSLVLVGCLLPWVCRSPFSILNGSSFGKHRVRQIFSPSLWLISLFSYWFLGEFPPLFLTSLYVDFLSPCLSTVATSALLGSIVFFTKDIQFRQSWPFLHHVLSLGTTV